VRPLIIANDHFKNHAQSKTLCYMTSYFHNGTKIAPTVISSIVTFRKDIIW